MVTRAGSERLRASTCVHHWVVQAPDGTTSWGVCRKCAKRRRFSNRFDPGERSNNSDIFIEPAAFWKPDRRPTAYPPQIDAAHRDARLAGIGS